MTPNVVFYQLLVVALVWSCLLVHICCPDSRSPASQMPRKPAKPRRKRAKAPKPFTGYLHKPLCEAGEQGLDTRLKAPGAPPSMIIFTRGRRRTVDTSGHFCPDPDCSYHGWLGRGNIRSNGHPGGQRWRQFQCVSCQGYFYETTGTMFHGKRSSPELIVQVITCLAEELGIRGTARVFGIDPNTVLSWLVEAAEQLQAFSAYCLREWHLHQVQLDELYAVLSAVREGDISESEAIEALSRSPRWVWTAIDPESKLMLSAQEGDRTWDMAQAMLHQITQLLAPGCRPLFLSDGNPNDLPAIVAHVGHWVPLPELLYAQVIKRMRRRRIVEVKRQVVIGTQAAVDQVWARCGWQISIAFIERLNLSLRQRVVAIRRRSASPCRSSNGLRHQLVLFQVYHHFVLPHTALRQARAEPIPTHGNGSAKLWQPRTPAMAAGLTDHVWSLREVLLFRVPPWPQPQTV